MPPMSEEERQKLISPHLRLKPTLHGLINVAQLKIPSSLPSVSASPLQQDLITRSLEQYESNLIPLIIRPLKEVDPDVDYDLYEVVSGEEIYHAAKELKQKEVWAWVFDLTDEAALQLRQEMALMAGALPPDSVPDPQRDPAEDWRPLLARQEQDIAALKNTIAELQGHQAIWANMADSLAKIQARLEQGIQLLDPPKPNINAALATDIQPLAGLNRAVDSPKPNINAASATDIQTLAGLKRPQATAIYDFIQQQANGIHAIKDLRAIKGVGRESIPKLNEAFSVAPVSL